MNSILSNQEKLEIEYFIENIKASVKLSKKSEERIRLVYAFANFIHHHQTRKDGTKFFEHPLEVVKILFDKKLYTTFPSENEIIIALLHDIIEDTEVEHMILESLFGKEIADSVEALSKKHWTEYVEDIPENILSKKEKKILKWIPKKLWKKKRKKWTLTLFIDAENSTQAAEKLEEIAKLLKSIKVKTLDILLHNNTQKKEDIKKIIQNLSTLFWSFFDTFNIDIIDSKFAENGNFYEELWKNFPHLKELARKLRDTDYYARMNQLDDETLNVKFADRIHNLRTTSHISKEKILQKIEETEKYFLPIAKERNSNIYKELVKLITKLKAELAMKE